MIAALFVHKDGCYFGLPGVDPWDKARDGRLYAGPFPVVAHPPCERWGYFWYGSPRGGKRHIKGDDGGCFESALASVRRWGGVLEHPMPSGAWDAFGLRRPPISGTWVSADFEGGWTCCVEQGAYGHFARKRTWLYACGVDLPSMKWGAADGDFSPPFDRYPDTPEGRAKAIKCGRLATISRWSGVKAATPLEFRDVLLSIASTAALREAA